MKTGIYKITNIKNGKVYIGSAARSFKERWNVHKWYLKKQQHHSKHLQSAWNIEGEQNFIFDIIEKIEPIYDILYSREQHYIDIYDACNPEKGYNIRLIAESNLGIKRSEESKQKIKGKNNPFFGKHHSEETKQKLREAHSGKHPSKETRKKMSESHSGEKCYWYGKTFSEEMKQKLREAKGGENHPNFGKHHSEETRKKMSESHSGEKSNSAKLTWFQVREIREKYKSSGYTIKQLCKDYNVSRGCITGIINNLRWKE